MDSYLTIPNSGSSLFRTMGTRVGEGSLIRIEGTQADAAIASAGEGELDLEALDALMAEGFE